MVAMSAPTNKENISMSTPRITYFPPLDDMKNTMSPITARSLIGAGGGLLAGGLNAIYSSALQKQQMRLEKEWWYEQQKFLEEHNSPAYQSMKMRQAGLNPYSGVSPQSLGSINSELPRRPNQLFNTGDIVGLMSAMSEIQLNDAHAKQLGSQAGMQDSQGELYGAQKGYYSQMTQNLIQEWFNLEIAYQVGLIDLDERNIKRNELREAFENGEYTPTSDAHRAAEDTHNESFETTREKKSVNDLRDDAVLLGYNPFKSEFELISAQIENEKARKFLIDAQTAREIAYEELLDSQEIGQTMQNKFDFGFGAYDRYLSILKNQTEINAIIKTLNQKDEELFLESLRIDVALLEQDVKLLIADKELNLKERGMYLSSICDVLGTLSGFIGVKGEKGKGKVDHEPTVDMPDFSTIWK